MASSANVPARLITGISEVDKDTDAEADEDMRFISAVIETCMMLHNSEYLGDITIDSIIEELESLDLADYPERAEFLELLKKLAK